MRGLAALLCLLWPLCACAAVTGAGVAYEPLPAPGGMVRDSGPDVKFLSGFVLDSLHDSFGGISGITLLTEHRFLAVTDRGWWIAGDLVRAPGTGVLAGVFGVRLAPLLDAAGHRLRRGFRDAEAVRAGPDGTVYVSFEHRHRVMAYSPGAPLPGAARATYALAEWQGLRRNSGLENLAVRADGAVLVLAEGKAGDGETPGWLMRGGRAACAVGYVHDGPLVPTDAAFLPDGSLLVLERALTLTGWRARLRHFILPPRREGEGCAVTLEAPRWQAELPAHWPLDNFEGLAPDVLPDGRVRAFLITDDNFKQPLERTLLLHVELMGLRLLPDRAAPATPPEIVE